MRPVFSATCPWPFFRWPGFVPPAARFAPPRPRSVPPVARFSPPPARSSPPPARFSSPPTRFSRPLGRFVPRGVPSAPPADRSVARLPSLRAAAYPSSFRGSPSLHRYRADPSRHLPHALRHHIVTRRRSSVLRRARLQARGPLLRARNRRLQPRVQPDPAACGCSFASRRAAPASTSACPTRRLVRCVFRSPSPGLAATTTRGTGLPVLAPYRGPKNLSPL